MKSILVIGFALAASFAEAQTRRLTLYDCARANPGFEHLVYEHQDLLRDSGRDRMDLYEHEQLLIRIGSCEAFAQELRRRMTALRGQAPRPTPQGRPGPREDRRDDHRPAPREERRPTTPRDNRRDDPRPGPRDERRPEPRAERRPEPRAERRPERRPEPRAERRPDRRPEPRDDRRGPTGNVPRAQGGVLIVTDERSPRAANIVAQTLQSVAPFSCLDIAVAIHQVDAADFGCTGESPRQRVRGHDRIVLCGNSANGKAQRYKREAGARHVIIVTENSRVGGNGGSPPVVTDSIILQGGPLAGIHELMHTFGFRDTYQEGNWVSEGDVMTCTGPNCYVLPGDYNRIARAFGKSLPSSCR